MTDLTGMQQQQQSVCGSTTHCARTHVASWPTNSLCHADYGCMAWLAYKPTPRALSSKFNGKLSAYASIYDTFLIVTNKS